MLFRRLSPDEAATDNIKRPKFPYRHFGYTDEDIISAAESSTSFSQICQKLGLPATGGNIGTVRSNLERLGIDPETVRHKYVIPYTEDQVLSLVSVSRSVSNLIENMGVPVTDVHIQNVRDILRRNEVDTSHFLRPVDPSYTDEDIIRMAPEARSMKQLCEWLGINCVGSYYPNMKKKLDRLGIDISHFKWQRETK